MKNFAVIYCREHIFFGMIYKNGSLHGKNFKFRQFERFEKMAIANHSCLLRNVSWVVKLYNTELKSRGFNFNVLT